MLVDRKLIQEPPKWFENTIYEVIVGSVAYGVDRNASDIDIIGVVLPPKEILFPYEHGYLYGFDRQVPDFNQFSGKVSKDAVDYDFVVYNVMKWAKLTVDNNPNMIDTLFVPDRCVLRMTDFGEALRDYRERFLNKQLIAKFKGYAISQHRKLHTKVPIGGRKESYDEYGYDLKFAYHMIRLMLQAVQASSEGTMRLDDNAPVLRVIRSGDYSLAEVDEMYDGLLADLAQAEKTSVLPTDPPYQFVRELLLDFVA